MRTPRSRRPTLLALASLALFLPSTPAVAQVYVGTTGPRPGSYELAVGGAFALGTSGTDRDATLTENPGGQSSFDLFNSQTKLKPAPGAQVLLGIYVTRSLLIEAGFHYLRPEIEVRLSDDFEGADDTTATSAISEYLFTGSAVYHFGSGGGKVTPFVAGGAGHIRDVHAGNGFVETGIEYHGKAGVKMWFGRRLTSGLRLEGGVSVRDGGYTLDEDVRMVPTFAAAYAYRF